MKIQKQRRSATRRKLSKSEQMARVRSKDTGSELTLRKAVWKEGLRYRLHTRLPGTPDLAFPGARVAIFVDGCFWHGCPDHYTRPVRNAEFWRAKLKRNRDRDKRVDRELKAAGWLVVRIWEHELRDDLSVCVRRVHRAVSRRRVQKPRSS